MGVEHLPNEISALSRIKVSFDTEIKAPDKASSVPSAIISY